MKQALRAWYCNINIVEFFLQNEYSAAPSDSSLFIRGINEQLYIVVIYVDVLVITRDDIEEIKWIRRNLFVDFR